MALQNLILLAIERFGPVSVLFLWKVINEATKHDYAEGAIYSTLYRLYDSGYVQKVPRPARAVRGSRAGNDYQITEAGKKYNIAFLSAVAKFTIQEPK